MFCTQCGQAVQPSTRFCSGCGAARAATAMLPPAPPPVPVSMVALAHDPLPPLVFAGESRREHVPPKKPVNPAATAAWILLTFACAGALIPGLGFGMWLIIAPILFITLVLGIVAISRGGAVKGVLIILMSLIVVPVFVFTAPFVGLGIAVGAAEAASEATIAAPPTELPFTTPSPTWKDDSEDAEDDAIVAEPEEPRMTKVEAMPVASAPETPRQREFAQTQDGTELSYPAAAVALGLPPVNATVSDAVRYAVLRTKPTTFSKGVGRLEPGTPLQLSEWSRDANWITVTVADGRQGYLRSREIQFGEVDAQ